MIWLILNLTLHEEDNDVDDKKIVKKAKKDWPIKHEAVMVVYKINDTMPDLQSSYNLKSGSLILSDLFDLNPSVAKRDVSINCIKIYKVIW